MTKPTREQVEEYIAAAELEFGPNKAPTDWMLACAEALRTAFGYGTPDTSTPKETK